MSAKSKTSPLRIRSQVPIQFLVEPELRQSFTDTCKRHQKSGTEVLRALVASWISEMGAVEDVAGRAALKVVVGGTTGDKSAEGSHHE